MATPVTRFQDRAVKEVFDSYPESAQQTMMRLRELVFETAAEHDDIDTVCESLKWGEPSYHSRTGTAVRMDWKPQSPQQVGLYFHCQTSLVSTYRELFRDELIYQGNRAVLFELSSPLPVSIIKQCVVLAFTYQRRKHLPLLGV